MKPHEETWTLTPVLTKREPRWGVLVEPDKVVLGLCAETFATQKHVDRAAEKMPARARLLAAAPDMARALLLIHERLELRAELHEAIEGALRKAGVLG